MQGPSLKPLEASGPSRGTARYLAESGHRQGPMNNESLTDQIAYVKSMLDLVTAELAHGTLPGQSLAEFQGTVESIRKTIWSLITSDADYRNCLGGYRVHRAAEMCEQVDHFLAAHERIGDPKETEALAATVTDLLRAMAVSKKLHTSGVSN